MPDRSLSRSLIVPGGGGTGSGSVTSQALSVTAAGLSVRIDTVSQGVSVLSQAVSVLSQAVSVVSQAVSVVSNAASAADAHASTASLAATSVDGRVNSVNAALSALSTRSVGNVSTHGTQSVLDALSNRISAVVGGSGSVTSQEVSVAAQTASAAATSVDGRVNSVNTALSALSTRSVGNISTHGTQSVLDALSNRISLNAPQFTNVSNPLGYTVSATALTTVSGLSVSISPGASYQIYAHIMYVVGSAAQPTGFGLIGSTSVAVGNGNVIGDVSIVASAGGDGLSTTRGLIHFWNQTHIGTTTALFSVNPGTANPTVHGLIIQGVIATSAATPADQRIHIGARASTGATGHVIVTAGSYIRMLRIL